MPEHLEGPDFTGDQGFRIPMLAPIFPIPIIKLALESVLRTLLASKSQKPRTDGE